MIFLPQTSTDLDAPAEFASKQTGIEGLALKTLGSEGDFCVCIKQCVPCLSVFTDKIGNDSFKNDKYRSYINVFTGSTTEIYLTRIDGSGNETDILVTTNLYGILDDGSASDPKYVSYEWNFFKIWLAHGFGKFKFRIDNLNSSSRGVQTVQSPVFCISMWGGGLLASPLTGARYGEAAGGGSRLR